MILSDPCRSNDDDNPTIQDAYLQIVSFLIETLYKTLDMNFSHHASILLKKCSIANDNQSSLAVALFWHVWLRCSMHMISLLPRTGVINFQDDRQQMTIRDLLLHPLKLADSERLDYSYATVWTQLFKALCRFALLDHRQSAEALIEVFRQLLRHRTMFENIIENHHHQRLFGFLLLMIKTLLKEFSTMSMEFFQNQKRSIAYCVNECSCLISTICIRLLSDDQTNNQWISLSLCMYKSQKISTDEQGKSLVFTFVSDMLIDFIQLCQNSASIEIFFNQLKQIVPVLDIGERFGGNGSSPSSSVLANKQSPNDYVIVSKIFTLIQSSFDISNGSPLLLSVYPLFIFGLQHPKIPIKTRARKCWNETFGRVNNLVYPMEFK